MTVTPSRNETTLESSLTFAFWCCRTPQHSVRVNSDRISVEAFCEELWELGCEAMPSTYLPEFVRVQSGLQQVLQGGFITSGLCQVCLKAN
jgi:hypothetical protein